MGATSRTDHCSGARENPASTSRARVRNPGVLPGVAAPPLRTGCLPCISGPRALVTGRDSCGRARRCGTGGHESTFSCRRPNSGKNAGHTRGRSRPHALNSCDLAWWPDAATWRHTRSTAAHSSSAAETSAIPSMSSARFAAFPSPVPVARAVELDRRSSKAGHRYALHR